MNEGSESCHLRWQEEAPPQLDLVGAGDSDSTSAQSLPEVPTDRIISACLTTSGLIAAVGLLIRGRASTAGPAALHTDPAAVASLLQCRYKTFLPLYGSLSRLH